MSANPGIFDTIGNIASDVVTGAGSTVQGVVNDVAAGAGSVISGLTGGGGVIVDSAGNVIGKTEGISGDIISGVVNDVVNDVANNILNVIRDTGETNGVFNKLICTVKYIVSAGNGIIGQILEIGQSILQVPFNILKDFENFLKNIIENLVNLSSALVNAITDAIKKITDIGTGVATTFDNFFKETLGLFIDFIIKPALSAANTAYAKVSAVVTKAIAAANVTIQGLVSNFDDKIKEAVALAANKVTNLAADLKKTLNSSVASALIIAECDTDLKLSLVEFAANTFPSIATCISSASVNVLEFVKKAIVTVDSNVKNAEAIVESLKQCLTETIANQKDAKAKDIARTCISSVSCC